MDSFGIGGAPDAEAFGSDGFTDEGADTLGHIAEAFASGSAVQPSRPLALPHLARLGLGQAHALSHGTLPADWQAPDEPLGSYACARSISMPTWP